MSNKLAEHICNQAFPALSIDMSEDLAMYLESLGYRKFEIVDEQPAPADGGPAFGELKQVADRAIKQGGISIRDYFAIHANADEVTALQNHYLAEHEDDIGLSDIQARYRYADQMLKERAK